MSKGFANDHPNRARGPEVGTDTWLTPPWILSALGEFDLDPCAHPANPTAKTRIFPPEDGLSKEWFGRVWLNPPYGRHVRAWLEKLSEHGQGTALVFARTDTSWFQKVISRASAAAFLEKRVRFMRPDLSVSGYHATTGSVLLAFGDRDAEILMNANLSGWKVRCQSRPEVKKP